jgi:ketosteroid isomerase-like protein
MSASASVACESVSSDEVAVATANEAFYQAFEAADLDVMSDLWEHSDRVTCVHPGWALLRGWSSVAASWAALFQSPERLQFILTNEQVVVQGSTAWVTVDENIIGTESGTVTSLNLFVRAGDSWQMVGHHGTAVVLRNHPREP